MRALEGDSVANMLCPQCWGGKTIKGAACPLCKKAGVVPDAQLSTHFALSELIQSATAVRKAIANVPTADHRANLTRLCVDCLEPVRAQFGPIHINSGLRTKKLNTSISGASSSAHVTGWAADLVPVHAGVTLKQIVDWVIGSTLAYDQIIYEGTWVHLARFSADGKSARKQALMMFKDSKGKSKYSAYNSNDPRVL